ncbi:penicillin-binding transpeptidase domain-containing protein [Paractinoplanes brasiliensis]|uniref:Penicillin-binding protein n=1 Tax=Paractinoplanes brasiliensis TaxID=52695 RepID=A0A4R6JMH3_9ACTN|nr:penicillin-binding transpeptidase domain-containing protein [Actinoplanes brasiliensis]TDO37067.1 penicillin-binding protein [Actinoplanes brasiliensis]GID32239.1 hypothetical protein Abr02nite_72220 [Actinoplanes brasiliensis]
MRSRRASAALLTAVMLGSGVAACGSGGAGGALDDFLDAWPIGTATGPVEVVTLREADFSKVEKVLRKLRGVTLNAQKRELAPSRMFARALLGTVDPVTADDLKADPGTLAAGDDAGHGGLQQRYDSRLRGTPALAVVIERDGRDEPVELHRTEPVEGTPVRTTIDQPTQVAADRATAAESRPSSLVAVRISDSAVLAGAAGLQSASTAVGLGSEWDLGVKAFSGTVSAAGDPAELAQAAFGQGQTAVSPIAMAGATAAVARGRFLQPRLVLDPAPAEPAADGAALDKDAVSALKRLMREVVTSGTGRGLNNVEGGPVFGKTGSAEFDNSSTETHAWFVGWQGDIAFAVLVENGGAGAETAVPIVRRFLTGLNG